MPTTTAMPRQPRRLMRRRIVTGAGETRSGSRCTCSQRLRHGSGSAPHAVTNARVVSQDGNRAPVAASCNVVCETRPASWAILRNDGLPAFLRSSRSDPTNTEARSALRKSASF